MHLSYSTSFMWTTVLLPLLLVKQVNSAEEANTMASFGMVFLAILGGFLLGHLTLSGFVLLLMAVVPQEEARSFSTSSQVQQVFHHNRVPRDIFYKESGPILHRDRKAPGANSVINSKLEIPEFLLKKQSVQSVDEKVVGRNGRFIGNLLRSDPFNCMPQVMCELITAREPGPETDTLNDYKYLIKEMLKSEDDDDDDDKLSQTKSSELYRTDSRKFKRKKKPSRRKNDDDSSPEDSDSKPSEEIKQVGMAELIKFQEDDALEDKALTEMALEDPNDFLFAMADTKKKDKLKTMISQGEFGSLESPEVQDNINPFLPSYGAGNAGRTDFYGNPNTLGYRYKRNIKLLENTLKNNKMQSIFRSSRALQESFIQRKQRELDTTNDIMDRVRIAAEVAGTTRSARKCRALFDNCPVSSKNGAPGIQGLVRNLRKAITGTDNGKKSNAETLKEIRNLIKEMQPSSGGSGSGTTDVHVVLNIGGPGKNGISQTPLYSSSSSTSTTQDEEVDQELDKTIHLYPTVDSSGGISAAAIVKTLPKAMISSLSKKPTIPSPTAMSMTPSNSNMTNNTNSTLISEPRGNTNEKEKYKIQLEKASKLLNEIPRSLTQRLRYQPNKLQPKLSSDPTNLNQVQERLSDLIKVIEPRIRDSSDSESEESSEETVVNKGKISSAGSSTKANANAKNDMVPKKSKVITVPIPPTVKPNQRQMTRYQRVYPHGSSSPPNNNQQQYHTPTSFMGSIFDFFFKDRQIAPLPTHPNEWVPSAQRHAKISTSPFDQPYYPSKPVQHVFPHGAQKNNYPNYSQRYTPSQIQNQHQRSAEEESVESQEYDSHEDFIPVSSKSKSNQRVNSKKSFSKQKNNPLRGKSKRRRPLMKYKNCC